MRRTRRVPLLRAATAAAGVGAAALLLAGCGSSSAPSTPSSSPTPLIALSSPSPANPTVAAALLKPADLGSSWTYLLFDGPDGLPPHTCDTGASAAAKVAFTSGSHVVVEDGTLFDSAADASAYIKREATGADCASTAAPAPRVDLKLAITADESYASRIQGKTCDDRVLFRRGPLVIDLVVPCTATTSELGTYVAAAVRVAS